MLVCKHNWILSACQNLLVGCSALSAQRKHSRSPRAPEQQRKKKNIPTARTQNTCPPTSGRQPTAGSDVMMTKQKKKKRAAWRLMVLQCATVVSTYTHLRPPLWVTGCGKTLSQRLLGKQWSCLKALVVTITNAHNDWQLDHQHAPPEHRVFTGTPRHVNSSFF